MISKRIATLGAASVTAALLLTAPAYADAGKHGHKQPAPQASPMPGGMMMGQMKTGLMMPMMNPANGRKLFASKGCVVCHSVNGVGGEGAPPLDASTMSGIMNPFEFAARMWRGAAAMVALQEEVIGEQIQLSGQELADIIAFAHNEAEQKQFSEADIPKLMHSLIDHTHGDEAEADEDHGYEGRKRAPEKDKHD